MLVVSGCGLCVVIVDCDYFKLLIAPLLSQGVIVSWVTNCTLAEISLNKFFSVVRLIVFPWFISVILFISHFFKFFFCFSAVTVLRNFVCGNRRSNYLANPIKSICLGKKVCLEYLCRAGL